MGASAQPSQREQALILSEELLSEIELGTLAPMAAVRKTSRLARLIDDVEAMEWLSYEIKGYTAGGSWGWAAERSNRVAQVQKDGKRSYWLQTVSEIQAQIEGAKTQLANEKA